MATGDDQTGFRLVDYETARQAERQTDRWEAERMSKSAAGMRDAKGINRSASGGEGAIIKRLSLLLATCMIFAALGCGGAEPGQADRSLLQFPILFCKRLNYQGLHIYDTFYQWRPGGGIYLLENPADPPEKHRIRAVIDPTTPQTLGNGIYFDPSLSYDAQRLLFSFKGSDGGNSTIYEIGIDGTGLRQVTNLDANGNPYKGKGTGHHDVKPCYLPDGRVVFTSTRYSGLVPCANNGVAILHVMNADGTDIHTISVNNVTEFDPCVMPDGRILFGRWEYVDRNALVIQSLWTVLPDGRNETALYANNMVFPEAALQAKPVPGNDALVVAAFTPHNAPPRGTIAMIDTRMGKNDPAAIFNFESPNKPTHDRGESCDPWALNENVVLYSGVPLEKDAPTIRADAPGTHGRRNLKLNAMMMIDRSGKRIVVHSDSSIDLHNPIPVVPRPLPRVNIDASDRTQRTGAFFVHDVYASMPGVKRGTIKWLRVLEETSRVSESPGGTWMNQTFSISAALAWSAKIFHGIVPVEPDGSVHFEAPAGRALYFQLLDQDYRLVRAMRTFIQATPGTTRSCTGCHEYNPGAVGAPRAIRAKQQKLRDESWGSGYLDYMTRVQPILDAKCVSCHGGPQGMAKGLDLSRGWTEFFNISYEHLTARRERMYTADLIAGICAMNGTAYWSCKVFDPYSHGSGIAPLADILLQEPHRDRLTQTEREQIFAWMDSNGAYFGTWDYTAAGPRAEPFLNAVERVKGVMKEAGCAKCHATEKGEIKRFDQWINLDQPEMSRVLRAPLPVSDQAEGGYGLALCRDRKVDQSFSRKGLIYGFGYAHGVMDLDKFPTQAWPKVWPPEGDPVTPFASANDPHYRKILNIIRDARAAQLARPRIDMPGAEWVGGGIREGRSRQILPQPLPDPLPAVKATVDENGYVRLAWESSARMIGLIGEIHRGPDAAFTPSEATKIARTERFSFCDTKAPPGTAHYAVVFVSDPAETCGTCKSGAVIDYRHPGGKPRVQALRDGERCPLSTFEPQRSAPTRAIVEVPAELPALVVTRLVAEPREGRIALRWEPAGVSGMTTYEVLGRRPDGTTQKLTPTPSTVALFVDGSFHGGQEASYAVVANAPRRAAGAPGEGAWLTAKPLPERKEPVFILNADATDMRLAGGACVEGNTLDLSKGGHASLTPAKGRVMEGPFSFVADVFFDEPGNMPVLFGFGQFNGAGWFLQKYGGSWRFHLSSVSCDGGKVPIGQWVRVVGIYDGTTATVFQNGEKVAEAQVPSTPSRTGQELLIGQYSANEAAYQVKGKIRDFSLYARVLKPEEIAAAGKNSKP
jgi:hypothetical protein